MSPHKSLPVILLTITVIASTILSACAPAATPTPVTVKETVVVPETVYKKNLYHYRLGSRAQHLKTQLSLSVRQDLLLN